MSETETEAQPTEAKPAEGDGLTARVGKLEDGQERQESKLDEVLNFLKGGAGPAKADPEPDIKAEVHEALEKMEAAKTRKERAATREQEFMTLQEQVKQLQAAAEVKPVEYNPHTNFWWQPKR